jgi:hypothetical protein
MNSSKALNVKHGYSLTRLDKIAAIVLPVLSLLVVLYAKGSSSSIWEVTKTLLDLRK